MTAADVDYTQLRYQYPLQQFPGLQFVGNGDCSPHSTYDYLALQSMLVPTTELTSLAIRAWKQVPAQGTPAATIYLDLPVRQPIMYKPSALHLKGLGYRSKLY